MPFLVYEWIPATVICDALAFERQGRLSSNPPDPRRRAPYSDSRRDLERISQHGALAMLAIDDHFALFVLWQGRLEFNHEQFPCNGRTSCYRGSSGCSCILRR